MALQNNRIHAACLHFRHTRARIMTIGGQYRHPFRGPTHSRLGGGHLSGAKWAQGLSTKLMEMTHHGQWLVRNFLIHDNVSGMLALERKEDLQIAIEEQQAMGLEGLAEEDRYLMEINLDDLETTSALENIRRIGCFQLKQYETPF
eukprot:scaffold27594_cov76-Skeletonema_dohrnii-CCMP3373.AAC.2